MKNFASIFIFCLLLSACKKNESTQQSSSLSRVKELLICPSDPIVINERSKIEFTYDNLNRVTKIKDIFIGPDSTGLVVKPNETLRNIDFTYIGTSNLPNSATILDKLGRSSISFYTYNSKGQLIIDSSVSTVGTNTIVYKYHYFDNSLSIVYELNTEIRIDSFFNQNNNVLKYSYSENSSYPLSRGFYNFEYDKTINPLFNLNIAPLSISISQSHRPFNTYWSFWNLTNKNNISHFERYSTSLPGFLIDSFSFKYFFDSEGRLSYCVPFNIKYPSYLLDTVYYKY